MLEGLFRRKKSEPVGEEEIQRESAKLHELLKNEDPNFRKNSEEWERREEDRNAANLHQEAENENNLRDLDSEIIRDLKQPIENIINELAEDLEKGEYSVIIGDDASGRIPTIIIAKIAQRIAERNGAQIPIVRFLAGSTGLWNVYPDDQELQEKAEKEKRAALKDQLGKIKDTVVCSGREPKKVLVVTDTISTGESVEELLSAIHGNDWSADVATIGKPDAITESEIREIIHARLVIGQADAPHIYNKKDLTGVIKSKEKVFAVPNPDADPDRVRAGRRLAKEVAEELFREYDEARNA